jgi:hypothetical protein
MRIENQGQKPNKLLKQTAPKCKFPYDINTLRERALKGW